MGTSLFGGRYKAQVIDSRSPGYLRRACTYVHLNPSRAGMVRAKGKLESFPWSSYPAYRIPRLRPSWLRVDRLLGEHGLQEDTARTRRAFERFMVRAQLAEDANEDLFRKGWKIGAEDFSDWLTEKLAPKGRGNKHARSDPKPMHNLLKVWCKRLWKESGGVRSTWR